MKWLLLCLLVLYWSASFSQKDPVFQINSSLIQHGRFTNGWIALDSGWKFKVGDNPEFANRDYPDSAWSSIRLMQDLFDRLPKSGIAWFRLHLKADSSVKRPFSMRIYQTGASEFYLDGKRFYQFGTMSANSDSGKYYSPNMRMLSFPVNDDSEHTLAIRFSIMPNYYPLYFHPLRSNLEIWISSIDLADRDNFIRYYEIYIGRIKLGIGVAIILCVLYLSFFLFFPSQRINLYFSICNFFFAAFLFLNSPDLDYHGPYFRHILLAIFTTVTYLLLLVYCNYRVFNQKFGWQFWSLLALGIIAIPSAYLVDIGLISTFLAVVALTDVMRISIKSIRTHRTGARIVLIGVCLNIIYWAGNLLTGLGVFRIPEIDTYTPFAFLIAPLSLAIFLGYEFGMTSQSLRKKLKEVEQLSKEKQEILSSQNITLEKQVKERTAALNESLDDLKSTQAQLIQSEKMASLGELTAGIAHEIQNPLNFVNNFSEVNRELLHELKEEIETGNLDEVKAIADSVIANEEKISSHGKRAESIVKGMLQHSRSSGGVKEPTDINELVDEYLRLCYHGLRARDKSLSVQAGLSAQINSADQTVSAGHKIEFNATIKTDFDPTIGKINIIPQDIGRVLLNLCNNAFYAVNEKKKQNPAGYEPTVSVSTRKIGDSVEIIVADNGNGISKAAMEKIFQPFFTTKPSGQGTGLGLSLSYDIIKAHGGELKAETIKARPPAVTDKDDQVANGEGARFIVRIPVN